MVSLFTLLVLLLSRFKVFGFWGFEGFLVGVWIRARGTLQNAGPLNKVRLKRAKKVGFRRVPFIKGSPEYYLGRGVPGLQDSGLHFGLFGVLTRPFQPQRTGFRGA